MFSLNDHFCVLVTRLVLKWRNIGRGSGLLQILSEAESKSRGKMIPSSHVSANNYRRGNSSGREEVRVHGEQERAKGEKGTIVAAATIGNFFGHRSSPRPTVIGRADGVAAGIRCADWPETRVRKSLAAEFNACRTGWFIAMTLFSSAGYAFPPIRWRVRETPCVSAHRRFWKTGNGHVGCVAELQHMDTMWTEFAFHGYRIQCGLSANSTDILFSLKKKKINYYFTNCRPLT